jgi:rhodanese-related sulfurtransferase
MTMSTEIDLEGFARAQADGAFVLDVRETGECLAGHVPGTRLMPLAQVFARQSELPHDVPIYVICATGNRSKTAADWLRGRGFDAVSVAGGTQAWITQGRPVDQGAPRSLM